MNTTFSNILIDHERCIFECMSALANNIMCKKSESNNFIKVNLSNCGYTDDMNNNLSDTRNAINKVNTQYEDTYKMAAEKINPVGLDVPNVDCDNDKDIKDYYKNLQTVVLDKFQELSKVSEGGKGWIKFIDTLSTPEERSSNYNIPEFNSVYNQFVKEKCNKRVSKNEVISAIKTVCNFDKNINQLIKEANDFSMERSKKVCLYKAKELPFSFEESSEMLAECVLISEQDFLFAQSLESRKHALLENLKNAHIILYGLSTHDPRNIKESALCRDINLSNIISQLESAIDDPILFVYKEEKSIQENNIGKVIDSFTENTLINNKKSLDKYKERALKSNCVGIYINNWKTPIRIATPFNEAVAIFNNTCNIDNIKNDSIERLDKLYENLRIADNIISSGNSIMYINEITSPAIKKAIEVLPFINKSYKPIEVYQWACKNENKHTVTKEDVSDAVSFLEKDINYVINSIKEDSYENAIAMKVYSESTKEPTIKVSKKERVIMNIDKLKNKIVTDLNNNKLSAKLWEMKMIEAQSKKVLASAARAISDADIKEEKESLKSFLESTIELENNLTLIINSNEG